MLIIMKASFLLIVIHILSISHLFAKIRNGYEPQLQNTRDSLQKLNALLREGSDLPFTQRLSIKFRVQNLIDELSYYDLTTGLLQQLRMISPDIYNDIDNIKDKRGRPTDVFIRMIPRDHARVNFKGVSFFRQSIIDEDAHVSEYGVYTVAVDIWIIHNALRLLCHEMGHIKFIVPNLSAYSDFYRGRYGRPGSSAGFIGHDRDDQSGRFASSFERRFIHDKEAHEKNGGARMDSIYTLLQRKRKEWQDLTSVDSRVPHPVTQERY
jgi:hypothetical protein